MKTIAAPGSTSPARPFPASRAAPRRHLLLALVLAAATLAGPVRAEVVARISLAPSVATDAEMFRRARIPAASVGYALHDLKTGQKLSAKDEDKVFIPASSIKVPTTLTALNILGASYRFETRLYTNGTVVDGVLVGDLFLKGGGDPVLTSDNLATMVGTLKRLGVTKVDGGFYYDSSFLLTADVIDPEEEEEASYNPGVGALSLNFNRVRLSWKKGRRPEDFHSVVESHTYLTNVPVDFVKISLAPRGTPMRNYLRYRPGENGPNWLLSPRIRRRGHVWLPIKQPGFYAAMVFRKIAQKEGLALPKPAMRDVPGDAKLVATHISHPLPRITGRVLRFSNNVATELIGMVAARRLTNTPQTIRQSAATLANHIKSLAPQADWTGYEIHNHSGLSTRTRVSPAQMIGILRFARTQRYGGVAYEDLLYRYRVNSRRVRYPRHVVVQAKTGTIDYVRAVVGFVTTRSGRRLAFALFISDHKAREAHAAANVVRAPYRVPRLRGWMRRAHGLQRAMVRKWVDQY